MVQLLQEVPPDSASSDWELQEVPLLLCGWMTASCRCGWAWTWCSGPGWVCHTHHLLAALWSLGMSCQPAQDTHIKLLLGYLASGAQPAGSGGLQVFLFLTLLVYSQFC